MKIAHQKYEQVTIKDIRDIEEFKDINDEEATEILHSIHLLSLMIYKNTKPKKAIPIESNQQFLQAA